MNDRVLESIEAVVDDIEAADVASIISSAAAAPDRASNHRCVDHDATASSSEKGRERDRSRTPEIAETTAGCEKGWASWELVLLLILPPEWGG